MQMKPIPPPPTLHPRLPAPPLSPSAPLRSMPLKRSLAPSWAPSSPFWLSGGGLPLSGTIVAVLTIYYGVARWNDYFTGFIMLKSRNLLPLQVILKEILASLTTGNSDTFFASYADNLGGLQEALRKAEVAKYCCIIVATVPAILLYIFMQKYFVKGVMIGSLKG